MVLGLVIVLRRPSRYQMLISLLVSVAVSTLLIIATTLLEGYWLIPRQLIHLSPTLMILAAVGVEWLVSAPAMPKSSRTVPWLKSAVMIGLVLLTAVAARERLTAYYAAPRETGREVANALVANHAADEPVFVIPGNEGQSYQFYLTLAGQPELVERFVPSSLEQLPDQLEAEPGRVYLTLANAITEDQLATLQSLGLERVQPPAIQPPARYQLFTRAEGSNSP
jgi:hypothetical protein